MTEIVLTTDYIKEYDLLFLKNGTNGKIWKMSDIRKHLKIGNRQYEGFEIPDGYVVKIYDGVVCYAVYDLTWLLCIELTNKKTDYLTGYNKRDKFQTGDSYIPIYEDIKICRNISPRN